MIKGREDLSFTFEAGESIGRVRVSENLQRDDAIQLRVARLQTSPIPPAPMAERIS